MPYYRSYNYDDYCYECETCERTFRTQHAAEQHMDAKLHWADDSPFECETCGKEFYTEHAVKQHMDALSHWAPTTDYDTFSCETCDKAFGSQNAVEQHMTALGHWAPVIPRRDFPPPCVTRELSYMPIQYHPLPTTSRRVLTPCPFCNVDCISASGLTQHLESGNCPSAPQLTRESILHTIRNRDPLGVITNRQIEWHKEEMVRYSATRFAFNGFFWECYLCHKEFNSSHALNAHLNSPTHKQKVYYCPNCEKLFVNLGGLFSHLESETCQFMRFDRVQQKVSDVLHGQKLLSFP